MATKLPPKSVFRKGKRPQSTQPQPAMEGGVTVRPRASASSILAGLGGFVRERDRETISRETEKYLKIRGPMLDHQNAHIPEIRENA